MPGSSGRAPRIAAIGPLPPPLHGMAIVHTRTIAAIAAAGATVDVIAVMPAVAARGWRYHLAKIVRVALAVPQLVAARARGARVVYCAVDGGWGGVYCCLYALTARLMRQRLFLHHHNYNYLMESTAPMRWLTRLAGAGATHVVLCDRMARDLAALYPAARTAIVAPNGIDLVSSVATRAVHEDTAPLRLGILSNLTPDKGVAAFIAIVERLRAAGVAATGTLAGPVSPPELADRVAARAADADGAIAWLGTVDDADKARFFAAIDVFVFPTRMESFGLVLLEALAHGVPVVAPAHGCICVFAGPAATIVPAAEDFVAAATAHLVALARTRTDTDMQRVARAQAEWLVAQADTGRAALVEAIVAGGT